MTLKSKLAASAAFVGLLVGAGAACAAEAGSAVADTVGADSVVVTASRVTAPTLAAVPGKTTVITADEVQSTSLANLSDALKFVPGLFAQPVSTNESARISIRGSGIGTGGFTYGEGVQILFDGLPLSSPFGTPYESFEPNAYNTIEVYEGANAFEYGATQLGGAINVVQHTGYDSTPLFVRLEGGSYGYQREQISSGQVVGPLDYYLTVTHFQTGGYQVNSAASSGRIIGNVGYQVTPELKTRFYFEDARQYQLDIHALTFSQLESNPQLNPFPITATTPVNGTRVNMGSLSLANKTTYAITPSSSLEFGVRYENAPLYTGNFTPRTYWDVQDWSASLKYRRKDTLFGDHESDTVIAFLPSKILPGSSAAALNVPGNIETGKVKYGGSNTTLLISNDFALTPKLWLSTGLAGIWQVRQNEIENPPFAGASSPAPAGVNPNLTKNYFNTTPHIGLRYNVTPNIEVFGNVTGLLEAPQVIVSYAQSANGIYTGYTTPVTTVNGVPYSFNESNLTVQTGTSYEAGIKGSAGGFKWDLDYYNEQINHELLTIYAVLPNILPAYPNGLSYTENAGPTVKEGVEASLEAVLWHSGTNTIKLRQSYTWNHYYFVHQAPEQKTEPGLPSQTYQAALNYNHESGFYAEGDLDSVLTPYPVDYANTQFAPSYTLLGAAIGYAAPDKKWRVFVQGQNLTNQHYASFTSATGLANATSAVYTPGEGRSVTAGVTYAF